VKRTVLNNNRG